MERNPIIHRKPIIRYYGMAKDLSCNTCKLNHKFNSQEKYSLETLCNGNQVTVLNPTLEILDIKNILTLELPNYIYLSTENYTSEKLVAICKLIDQQGKCCFMHTYDPISEEVLKILQNNPFNVLQVSMSGFQEGKEVPKEQLEYQQKMLTMLELSKKNSIYNILRIEPIIISVTPLKDIIKLISVSNSIIHNIQLKFGELCYSEKNKSQFINYEFRNSNIKIPIACFEQSKGKLISEEMFMLETYSVAKEFANGVPCCICGRTKEPCTGKGIFCK